MLEPGLQATVEEEVSDEMTAGALGSGDVPVLATPAVLALAEAAAVSCVAGRLDTGETTVGTSAELAHLAPTPVGSRVTAVATLEAADGSTLRFSFEVHDPAGVVARGTHTRVVVQRDRFLEGARRRA